ncbi:MAG: DUF116 domain-containing protein [Methanomicrobiales archaeon]|jgi:hypothetical protein|nr:DUF116 domain-containing protein [Burkholderiaceae bacterium]NLH26760.1 DUF116 domain-containing protein [Methanomicrobiales archaeon]HMZ31198.1 DUF116 domain-containing protein [Methanoregulaceae archaeon]HNI41627.1 DUF116 domain-containing protein [Methanoregulaceae archaeon]HNJ81150.1 DUF116 domain-containing protein [Methanoregulaceae archaeon]
MLIENSILSQFIFLIGEITLLFILGSIVFAILMVTLALISIKRGKIYFPSLIKAGVVLVEGLMKALFRLFGLEDQQVNSFFIELHNSMNKRAFEAVPVSDRAIFLPQCLRSSKCPAHLTPEGLKCKCCGLCMIGYWLPLLEKMGYRVFSVPGSSFIKRMVRKYRPKAIIGVGCMGEVKEGLEMSDKLGLISMGVVTLKEGCVETYLDWEMLLEIAKLGVDPGTIPPDLITLPKNNNT